MTALHPRSFALLPLVLAAALVASSCQTPLRPRGPGNEGLVARRLSDVQPVEVVVPPIENHTEYLFPPLDIMREEFQKGLVRLRYSPLALSYVDKNASAVEASYRPGMLGEQAALRVVLTGWDDSRFQSFATLTIDADVYLLDAAQPELSQALWGGHASHTIDLSRQRNTFINAAAMERRAVEMFVQDVLESLPARDVEAPRG